MERKKQIEVEEKEVARKDKELVATVKRPAEAESYKVETIAQGRRCVLVNVPFVLCAVPYLVHANHFLQQTHTAKLRLPRNM